MQLRIISQNIKKTKSLKGGADSRAPHVSGRRPSYLPPPLLRLLWPRPARGQANRGGAAPAGGGRPAARLGRAAAKAVGGQGRARGAGNRGAHGVGWRRLAAAAFRRQRSKATAGWGGTTSSEARRSRGVRWWRASARREGRRRARAARGTSAAARRRCSGKSATGAADSRRERVGE